MVGLALAAVVVGACAAREGPLVVSGGTLIDGTGAPPRPGAVIVVEGGRISCAGGPGACTAPAGARRVDATGFWIVPGLLDVDVPRALDARSDEVARRERLRFLLGVTTERVVYEGDPGPGAETETAAARDATRPVPRRVMGRTGMLPRVVELEDVDMAGSDAAPAVWARRNVWLEPRLLARELRVEPYRLSVGLHRLLELPWLVAALRAAPTAGGTTGPDRDDAEDARAPEAVELDLARAWVRDFHASGGAVVTGSGGALVPGLSILAEMRALVAAGLDPEAALAAATREAAAAIGVSDSLGTIAPGKLADFVVLEGDPLADIRNMEIVSRVVKGGVLHDPSGLFDDLRADLSDRSTGGTLRRIVVLAAMLVAVAALAWAVRRHRASLPSSWRA